MSVKRYRMYHDPMGDCCCEMDEKENGGYVSVEDYDALRAERDEAVALLRYVCSLHPDDCGCSGCKFAFLAKIKEGK